MGKYNNEDTSSNSAFDSPWGTRHPQIQILTIEQLLDNRKIDYPGRGIADSTFKEAQKVRKETGKQGEMF